MGNTVEMAWTVVPQNMDNGEVFEMSACNIGEGFGESKGGMNNNVDGDDGQRGINFSPLEVVLRTNLNGGRGSKAERNDGSVNRAMAKLPLGSISLKSS